MSQEQQQTPSQEVGRIRDIIFGTQMREYESQFGTVRRDLERLQGEIDQLSEQLAEQDRNQNERLQALRRDVRKADDDLRTELRDAVQKLTADKVARVELGDLLIEMGNCLKAGAGTDGLLRTLVAVEQEADRGG